MDFCGFFGGVFRVFFHCTSFVLHFTFSFISFTSFVCSLASSAGIPGTSGTASHRHASTNASTNARRAIQYFNTSILRYYHHAVPTTPRLRRLRRLSLHAPIFLSKHTLAPVYSPIFLRIHTYLYLSRDIHFDDHWIGSWDWIRSRSQASAVYTRTRTRGHSICVDSSEASGEGVFWCIASGAWRLDIKHRHCH